MKPTMRVVVLQQQCHILTGSHGIKSLSNSPEGFNWDEDDLDDSDILR